MFRGRSYFNILNIVAKYNEKFLSFGHLSRLYVHMKEEKILHSISTNTCSKKKKFNPTINNILCKTKTKAKIYMPRHKKYMLQDSLSCQRLMYDYTFFFFWQDVWLGTVVGLKYEEFKIT